jgi:D-tagatose-1,6-bisphosphate aldolase subunit GatZ/KbaZ
MVKDHFAILKVGPALTFSFREAVFGLAAIESELIPDYKCSRIVQVLEDTMVSKPEYWQKHYHGTAEQQRLARKYSFSDRSRYYWSQPVMQSALEQLLDNLHHSEIPLALFSQYFPQEYLRIRSGKIPKDPNHIILSHIGTVLANYEEACGWDFLR